MNDSATALAVLRANQKQMQNRQLRGKRSRAAKIALARDWLSSGKAILRGSLPFARGVHSDKLHFDRPSFYFNLSWIYVRIIGKRTHAREKVRGGKRNSSERERAARFTCASFLGVFSLTTIQFAFYPINRATRRTFPAHTPTCLPVSPCVNSSSSLRYFS